jgi:hypothetical protein
VRSLTTAAVGCSKHRFREAAVKGREFGTFHCTALGILHRQFTYVEGIWAMLVSLCMTLSRFAAASSITTRSKCPTPKSSDWRQQRPRWPLRHPLYQWTGKRNRDRHCDAGRHRKRDCNNDGW